MKVQNHLSRQMPFTELDLGCIEWLEGSPLY